MELGLVGKIDWMELPERKASRIRTYTQFDFDNKATWDDAFQWLAQTCIKFKKVFTRDWTKSTQPSPAPYGSPAAGSPSGEA